MRALYLLRHSLTEANERRLYCGWTDLPLSPAGRALALETRLAHPLPPCELYVTSGLARADQTLRLLTGHGADLALPDLREMAFGAFEMRAHDALCGDGDYRRWMLDREGDVRCPGGESRREFAERVARGREALLDGAWRTATAVVHGGVIARLMADWFPGEERGFYDWQPAPCRGWRVEFEGWLPALWREV